MKFLIISLVLFIAFVNGKTNKKVICYFTNWSWNRPGIGSYTPENIDGKLCTHIIYAFTILNEEKMEIQPSDIKTDVKHRFYERVAKYRSQGIKVLTSIGGWTDSGNATKYGHLLTNEDAQNTFVTSVCKFLEKYKMDGLDLDLEYPTCWQGNCKNGNPKEKEGFVQLIKKLREEFEAHKWILTAAVSPGRDTIESAYDIPALSEYLNYINLMTYDYHGSWESQTGHVAPLSHHEGDQYDYLNIEYTVKLWLAKGADPEKVILGMPGYGKSFKLQNPKKHGLNDPSSGAGDAGFYTKEAGTLSFYEICNNTKNNGWTVVREYGISPYAYKGDQWVSYDDIDSIATKTQYIKNMGLAGGMIWALDLDDFANFCGCGKYPLLTKINHDLRHNVESNIKMCT